MSYKMYSSAIINNEYIMLKISTLCIIDNINDMLRLSFTKNSI